MGDSTVEVALHVHARHAEGPLWDAATARLWWVDIAGTRVHCFDPSTGRDEAWTVAGEPGGVVLDGEGAPIVAMPEGLAALDRTTGAAALVVPIERERPENRANDAKVDRRGRLWVGTMPYDKRPAHAALYRVDQGAVTRMVDGLTISNGPAIDEDRQRLYLADTALGRVDVFDLDPAAGMLSGRRRFLDVRQDGWWPDGMTVDDDGTLWVALGRAGAVRGYRPDAAFVASIELPTTHPTSVAFGGVDGRDLYITTSYVDVPAERRPGEPLAGAIFRCRPGVRGPASPRYRRAST